MASGINIYSELLISRIRIVDIIGLRAISCSIKKLDIVVNLMTQRLELIYCEMLRGFTSEQSRFERLMLRLRSCYLWAQLSQTKAVSIRCMQHCYGTVRFIMYTVSHQAIIQLWSQHSNLLWQQKQHESVNKFLETRSSVIAERPCKVQRQP